MITALAGAVLSQNEEKKVFSEHQLSVSTINRNPLSLKGVVYYVTDDQKFLYETGLYLFFSGLVLIFVGEIFVRKLKI
ncbi:hypothetical protein QN372_20670 [Undibacterium sp. RTI2.1]|uniref:hypothetical protein n=1 Tax=unclassified Undibacterium TaxID=2630295 RepID=UPI002B22527E|nr:MULTISPECIES: hypothetical protein [unclassified Undibacterium]MEB0033157.1 hypothetical protein [Undibacterium sp. RTI2.1]MEB0118956.1 hypothetical protein [Undibacterium sp. RTI2.2]